MSDIFGVCIYCEDPERCCDLGCVRVNGLTNKQLEALCEASRVQREQPMALELEFLEKSRAA